MRQRIHGSVRRAGGQSARARHLLDRRLRSVDSQSRQSRTGLVDVPADLRDIPATDSLGDFQIIEGANGRAAKSADRGGRFGIGSNRTAGDWWNLDAARI